MDTNNYQDHTLPAPIAGPTVGEGDADELPAEVLSVWLARSALHRTEAEAIGDLLGTLSQAHGLGQQVVTA